MLLTPAQIKPKIVWIETELFLFLPRVDASRVYLRAWALGCFYSHISTSTFRRALTASLDSCREWKVECPVAARCVTNEVVTNRAGIAPFFSHLDISTCDIVSVTCVCVCARARVGACVLACVKERETETMSHVLISKWEKKGAMPARFVTTSLVTKRAVVTKRAATDHPLASKNADDTF